MLMRRHSIELSIQKYGETVLERQCSKHVIVGGHEGTCDCYKKEGLDGCYYHYYYYLYYHYYYKLFGSHPAMFRTSSWLCTQGPLQVGLDTTWSFGMEFVLSDARQDSYSLYYLHRFSKVVIFLKNLRETQCKGHILAKNMSKVL